MSRSPGPVAGFKPDCWWTSEPGPSRRPRGSGASAAGLAGARLAWRECLHQVHFLAAVTTLPALLVTIPLGVVVALNVGSLASQIGAEGYGGAVVAFVVVGQAAPLVCALIVACSKGMPEPATSQGTVLTAATVEADQNRAVIALFVDQEITNRNDPEPRIDRNRMRMTLIHENGRWLIGGIELL